MKGITIRKETQVARLIERVVTTSKVLGREESLKSGLEMELESLARLDSKHRECVLASLEICRADCREIVREHRRRRKSLRDALRDATGQIARNEAELFVLTKTMRSLCLVSSVKTRPRLD